MVDNTRKKFSPGELAGRAYWDDWPAVLQMLSRGADPNDHRPNAESAFFYAVRAGKKEVIQVFLAAGADPDMPDNQDNKGAPLLWAVQTGNIWLIELLFAHGVRARNPRLMYAASHQHNALQIFPLLIKASADINTRDKSNRKRTALHAAAAAGKTETIAWLLTAGANINLRDENDATPLVCAAEWGKWDAVTALIKAGANIDRADKDGKTVLSYAISAGCHDVVTQLLKRRANVRKQAYVALAAGRGRWDIMRDLIDHGADVNKGDGHAVTALHHAASGGKTEMMDFLLGRGANINQRDAYGETPLYKAAKAHHRDAFRFLMYRGADVTVASGSRHTFDSETVLHQLAWSGQTDLAEQVLVRGAKVDVRDNHGWTPLWCAVAAGNLDMVKVLVKAGADVNTRYKGNESILWQALEKNKKPMALFLIEQGADCKQKGLLVKAAETDDIDIVRALLQRGAKVDQTIPGYDDKRTALMKAIWRNDLKMADLLFEYGSDITLRNGYGHTTLHAAAERANPETITWLLERGADPNEKTKDGKTLDHLSWCSSDRRACADLLKRAADLRAAYLQKQREEKEKKECQAAEDKKRDGILRLIAAHDMAGLRAAFDLAFWYRKKPELDPLYLKEALTRDDRSALRLLVVWGAVAMAADIDAWSGGDAEKKKLYVRILRGSGLRVT